MTVLSGETIVVGVSAGVAAYKTCDAVSSLVQMGACVHVVMSENATQLVSPVTFQAISSNPVSTTMWGNAALAKMDHIHLAEKAACLLVAPATANILAKTANGIADDLLSTTILTLNCPKVFAPAMNTRMWNAPPTKRNIETVKSDGVVLVGPASGHLACGDEGIGRMSSTDDIINAIIATLKK